MAGSMRRSSPLIGAIDQGTSSTRFYIFAGDTGEVLTYHQIEVKRTYPREGWVEQDPKLILRTVEEAMEKAVANLDAMNIDYKDIQAIGVTNQRETTVVWDKETGEPLHNAILWLDTRTAETVEDLVLKTPGGKNKDYLRKWCGLPLATYFSAVKIRWLLDNNDRVRAAVEEERALFGTIDSWIIWNLTGGAKGQGIHVTDVTNASRTMLLNIDTLQWDPRLLEFFDIPRQMLPQVRSSSEVYGVVNNAGRLRGVAISGILGDQQAALVGQGCFSRGSAKNTYGTGCFLLYNIGNQPIISENGLLTTVAYKMGPNEPPCYALEGSIAIAGAAVGWLKDQLGLVADEKDVETLASSVPNTGGVFFVPAFSGLFCPYWESSARGTICGLSQFTNKAHICRATLEAVCFQTKELLEAMHSDCGIVLQRLQVDGGMSANNLLLQMQADVLGIPVVRPSMVETTALGAAYVAGKALDIWSSSNDDDTSPMDTYIPTLTERQRDYRLRKWKDAVQRSFNWMIPGESYRDSGAAVEGRVRRDSTRHSGENHLSSFPLGTFVFCSIGLVILGEFIMRAQR